VSDATGRTPDSGAASLPATADVVIVGAGLAGLSAAIELLGTGLDVVVLEASDDVGGRVRSDRIDGIPWALDRGFQVFNPAYPTARTLLDYDALHLCKFDPGVLVHIDGRLHRLADPRRAPGGALGAAFAPVGSLASKLQLARYALKVSSTSTRDLEAAPDMSMRAALHHAGIGDDMIERVLQPFLSGVFLESDLDTSRHFGDLVLRSFVRGTPALPADGMGEISHQLAQRIPSDRLQLNVRVTAVTDAGVTTEHGVINAPNVIVAADPARASLLLDLPQPTMRSVTTWYHLAPLPGDAFAKGSKAIVVDGSHAGPLSNAYVVSNVVRDRALLSTTGASLVASSALGVHDDAISEHAAREHLALLFGVDTSRWDLVKHYPIAHALPAMLPPFTVRQPVHLSTGRYVAGDHRDTASIQGALVSGRRAARALLHDRGITKRTHNDSAPDSEGRS